MCVLFLAVRTELAKAEKLRKKTPEPQNPRARIRRSALEILFFGALAVFAFSVVSSLIGAGPQQVINMPILPDTGADDAENSVGLYEAPSQRPGAIPTLSPIFTPSVQYWEEELIRWSSDQNVDPNLAATVMQIESCGNPTARSSAGAMGLFQVMPFHFEASEDPYDPDTNALRGLSFLAGGLEASGGHAGLALAGYNGGHGVIYKDYEFWHSETQRYFRWGSGIYREASSGWSSSPTLEEWLSAGGQSLCSSAEEYLGIAGGSALPSGTH